jgi:hypothetical protein
LTPSTDGDAAVFIGKKAGAFNSPSGAQNVAWLKLGQVQGSAAKIAFR